MKRTFKIVVLLCLTAMMMLLAVSCELPESLQGLLGGSSDVQENTLDETTPPEETEPHEHTEEILEAVEPTCTETGLTEGVWCPDCEEILVEQETLEALGHIEIIDSAVIPTCTEDGLTEGWHCSRCDEVLVEQEVLEALGHTEVITNAIAPTCTATGLTEGKVCTACNTIFVAQEIIDALGHTEVIDEAVDPTCTETGLTEGKHCSVCNEVLVQQTVVDTLAHTEVIDAAVEPTCTKDGLTEGKHCSVCSQVLVWQTNIAAFGHTEVTDQAIAPTCTEDGLTEGKHCSICNEVFAKQEIIERKGHQYKDTICTVCGDSQYLVFELSSDGTSYSVTDVNSSYPPELVIPSIYLGKPVTNIDMYAFSNCSSLTSITIPDSITYIGSYAFRRCSRLTSITIPNSVTSINKGAFEGCSSLTSITLPFEGTRYFGCFFGASSYTENKLYIPASLKTVVITDGTVIDEYAFYDCSGLTNITIPDSVTNIGKNAFQGCSSLTSITIPDSVSNIGFGVLEDCSNLTSIILPFVGASKDGISNNHLGYLFGTPYVDSNYAYVPTSLKTIVITGGTNIGYCAFYGCSGLKSITIPDSVTSIGNYAFAYCSGLTDVYITDVEAWLNISFGDFSAYPNYYGDLHILDENGTEVTELIIPDNITKISEYAFYGCKNLTSITIPDSVTSIGYDAFGRCSSLTAVYITDVAAWCNIDFSSEYSNPLSYAGNLYLDGELITELVIPNGVTSISSFAFYGCKSLTSIAIPDSVTNIGYSAKFADTNGIDEAFAYCSSLTSITVSEGNTVFEAKGNCLITKSSKTLVMGCQNSVIPTDGCVTSISDDAFVGCTGLTSIIIPDSVTSIGDDAFYDCSSLTGITIPESVTHIDSGAFSECRSLTAVYITDIAAWCNINFGSSSNSNPLSYAKKLYLNGELVTELVIPDDVTNVGIFAFYAYSSLISITIPNSVTFINNFAFASCRALTTITFQGTVEQWNAITFGASWNKNVPATEVICSDGVVALN